MNALIIEPPERKKVSTPISIFEKEGSFSGYASLFGRVDLGKDRVERGAFKKALNVRKNSGVRMLFQHDPSEPIGVWEEIREDSKGLFVRGRIVDSTSKGREVLELMRAGAIDGLSIGFRTEKSRTNKSTGVRTILEADLWEISVVTFPMLPQARVEHVKAGSTCLARSLPTIREFEKWLTQDAGFSRKEARTVIGKGYASLVASRDAADSETEDLVKSIRQASNLINSLQKQKAR